jgi:hypothetical protein
MGRVSLPSGFQAVTGAQSVLQGLFQACRMRSGHLKKFVDWDFFSGGSKCCQEQRKHWRDELHSQYHRLT